MALVNRNNRSDPGDDRRQRIRRTSTCEYKNHDFTAARWNENHQRKYLVSV
ncbi:unnamed protein product [Arabidopsis halleri]